MNKPLVCIDFDGVLNTYTGWQGPDYLYNPRPGVKEFLEEIGRRYTIGIFSTRDPSRLREWFELHDLPYDKIITKKVPALAYIDDRALRFDGDYEETLNELVRFQTHWEKGYAPTAHLEKHPIQLQIKYKENLEHNLAYEKSMHRRYKKEVKHMREQLEIAIATEKTELGRSVLKQFREQIS